MGGPRCKSKAERRERRRATLAKCRAKRKPENAAYQKLWHAKHPGYRAAQMRNFRQNKSYALTKISI